MTSLNHETVNGALVLKPSRRIDSSSAKAFEDDAAALLDKGPKKVVIDATDLDYISDDRNDDFDAVHRNHAFDNDFDLDMHEPGD